MQLLATAVSRPTKHHLILLSPLPFSLLFAAQPPKGQTANGIVVEEVEGCLLVKVRCCYCNGIGWENVCL